MRLGSRVLKLESRQKQQQVTCHSLAYFYGEPSEPIPLIPGLSLADFYNQHNKELLHADTQN